LLEPSLVDIPARAWSARRREGSGVRIGGRCTVGFFEPEKEHMPTRCAPSRDAAWIATIAVALAVVLPAAAEAKAQRARLSVSMAPVLPSYGCSSHSVRGIGRVRLCGTYHSPETLIQEGDVVLGGAERVRGRIDVVYARYDFIGLFAFPSKGPSAAGGLGYAEAAWVVSLHDAQSSRLFGTFAMPIELRTPPRAARDVHELRLSASVGVSGGTGRFAGLRGACGAQHCRLNVRERFTVRSPAQLNRTPAIARAAQAATSGELGLSLTAGNPDATVVRPPQDRLPVGSALAVSAPPGSSCSYTATAVPTNEDPGERRVESDPVVAGDSGAVVLPARPLGISGAAERQWRIVITCTPAAGGAPIGPAMLTVTVFDQPAERCLERAPGADLHGCDLRGADLRGAKLAEASLERANLQGADLTGADLTGVQAMEATLRNAKLTRATLTQGEFIAADVRGADLNGARLKRASFYTGDLTGAAYATAKFSMTTCPDGDIVNFPCARDTPRPQQPTTTCVEGNWVPYQVYTEYVCTTGDKVTVHIVWPGQHFAGT
jgi:hypothetical protein